MASHKSPSVPADQDNGFVRKVTVNLVVTFIKNMQSVQVQTHKQKKKKKPLYSISSLDSDLSHYLINTIRNVHN